MNLLVCGVNHKTAPLAFREKLVLAEESIEKSLKSAVDDGHIQEGILLSTCNRAELYCVSDTSFAACQWMQTYFGLTEAEVAQHIYLYGGVEAIQHSISVASGLDSMVLGEPQIFGQIKDAYRIANTFGFVGPHLSQFFQFVFSTTKRIRTETAIGEQPVSIASASVDLAECIFTDLSQLKVLLIGAGEISTLAARHFHEHGVVDIIAANRTLEKAQELASRFSDSAITLDEIPTVLSEVDIILTATASKEVILTKAMIEKSLKRGRKRPMFILDVAVPRNVEDSIGNIDGVYLYNIDDLKQITAEGLDKRKKAAEQATKMISLEAVRFMKKLQERDHSDTIRAYREKVDQLREKELTIALEALQRGQRAEDVLSRMARSLTNKLMHHPSVLLRNAGSSDNKDFLEIAKRIFELDE